MPECISVLWTSSQKKKKMVKFSIIIAMLASNSNGFFFLIIVIVMASEGKDVGLNINLMFRKLKRKRIKEPRLSHSHIYMTKI